MAEPRHALADDLDELAATLAAAFEDDPLFGWIYPEPRARPGQLRRYFRLSVDIGIRRGHTYTLDGRQAAAIWAPPDVAMFDDRDGELLYGLLAAQLGERAVPTLEGLRTIGGAHPRDVPHFYLYLLGTRPEAQGRGLGAHLVRAVLDRCDAEGLGAHLESSSARNVPFYERHGFRVTAEVELPGGPVVRPMWRDPR